MYKHPEALTLTVGFSIIADAHINNYNTRKEQKKSKDLTEKINATQALIVNVGIRVMKGLNGDKEPLREWISGASNTWCQESGGGCAGASSIGKPAH